LIEAAADEMCPLSMYGIHAVSKHHLTWLLLMLMLLLLLVRCLSSNSVTFTSQSFTAKYITVRQRGEG